MSGRSGNRQKTGHRLFSLRVGLILMVILCWVLPLCIVIGVQGYYINHSLAYTIADMMLNDMRSASGSAYERLQYAIKASLQASYDRIILDSFRYFSDNGDSVVFYNSVTNYLSRSYKNSPYISGAVVFTYSDMYRFSYVFRDSSTGVNSGITYYRQAVHPFVISTVETMQGENSSDMRFLQIDGHIYVVRNICDTRLMPVAVIVCELDHSFIFSPLLKISCVTDAAARIDSAYISPGDGNDSLSITVTGDPRAIDLQDTPDKDVAYFYRSGSVYHMSYSSAAGTDRVILRCYARSDAFSMLSEGTSLRTILIFILLMAIPLVMAVIYIFYRFVTRPLRAITDATSHIKSGELGYSISYGYESAEMADIMDSFNSMSRRLQELFERSRYEQLALQDARLKALQSQINPHFLNNTLEAINWEARMAGDDRVIEMIEALSTMLNAATLRSSNSLIPLSQELTYVDAYLYIISVRFGKRLTVSRDIDPNLMDRQVPQLVMQPVVENAVEHGVASLAHGELNIRIYESGPDLIIDVENNGTLSPEDAAAVEKLLNDTPDGGRDTIGGAHVGIRNVNQRLRLLYGPDSGLEIMSSPSGGTLARIRIKSVQLSNSVQ